MSNHELWGVRVNWGGRECNFEELSESEREAYVRFRERERAFPGVSVTHSEVADEFKDVLTGLIIEQVNASRNDPAMSCPEMYAVNLDGSRAEIDLSMNPLAEERQRCLDMRDSLVGIRVRVEKLLVLIDEALEESDE